MTKILCVEDEAGLRADIVEELEDAGYATFEASNGVEGLEAILKFKPDLVLCDITMPGMSGHELLTQLRTDHPEFRSLPFLFLSALANRNDILTGMGLGADDYLTKPVDFDILLATVSSRLEQVERMDGQKSEELDELRKAVLGFLPHEMRTPLNSILGYSELIRGEFFGPLGNDKYKEYAEYIHQSGSRLLTVVEDALSLLDVCIGELNPTLESCSVLEIIDDCITDNKVNAENKGVVLRSDVEISLPKFETDPQLLKRALNTVVSNAVKFTKEQGRVNICAHHEEDGALLIEVSDDGIGISDEHINKVVVPFAQAQSGAARAYEGAALSLPVAKALIEVLGGELLITSKMGVGTSVKMTFPSRLITNN